jgi:hypothetical protein
MLARFSKKKARLKALLMLRSIKKRFNGGFLINVWGAISEDG